MIRVSRMMIKVMETHHNIWVDLTPMLLILSSGSAGLFFCYPQCQPDYVQVAGWNRGLCFPWTWGMHGLEISATAHNATSVHPGSPSPSATQELIEKFLREISLFSLDLWSTRGPLSSDLRQLLLIIFVIELLCSHFNIETRNWRSLLDKWCLVQLSWLYNSLDYSHLE